LDLGICTIQHHTVFTFVSIWAVAPNLTATYSTRYLSPFHSHLDFLLNLRWRLRMVKRRCGLGNTSISPIRYGIPPYAELMLPRLSSYQRYDISLDLVIPTTEANYALGNFMSSLTLTHADSNVTLAHIRRPTIVLAPNFGRLSFWKSGPPVSTQHVHLMDEFMPRTSRVLAKVELGRRDGWKSIGNGEGRELSVISASLKGTIKHHGIRGLVTRFPVSAAFISMISFLTVSSVILATCLLPSILNGPELTEGEVPPSTPSYPDQKQFIASPRSYASEDSDADEKAMQRKQRRKSRGSRASSRRSSRSVDIKDEPSSSSIFPSVRRRRSRPFSEEVDT